MHIVALETRLKTSFITSTKLTKIKYLESPLRLEGGFLGTKLTVVERLQAGLLSQLILNSPDASTTSYLQSNLAFSFSATSGITTTIQADLQHFFDIVTDVMVRVDLSSELVAEASQESDIYLTTHELVADLISSGEVTGDIDVKVNLPIEFESSFSIASDLYPRTALRSAFGIQADFDIEIPVPNTFSASLRARFLSRTNASYNSFIPEILYLGADTDFDVVLHSIQIIDGNPYTIIKKPHYYYTENIFEVPIVLLEEIGEIPFPPGTDPKSVFVNDGYTGPVEIDY